MKTYSEDKTYQTSDDVTIFYNIHRESKTKSFLVFVHGLGGDLTAWNEEREYFHDKHYSTIALDLRGHGLSDRAKETKDYSLARFADDILEILHVEKIKKPIIIGHCFGGIVSIHLEALHNKTSQKLILVDTGYKAPPIASTIFDVSFFRWLHAIIAPYAPSAHIHAHRNFSLYKGTGDYDIRRIFSDVTHTSLRTYFLCSNHLLHLDASDLLKKITVPTLIVEGSKDSIYPMNIARELHDGISHAKLKIIPDANHIIVLNNPTDLSQTLEHFIES